MSYQVIPGGIIERETGKCIPLDPSNVDYQRYLAWVDAGNQPIPMATPPRPTLDQEYRMLNEWVKAVAIEAGITEETIKQRVDTIRKSR